MAKPSELCLEQECFNARNTTGSQNFSVWHSVYPLDASSAAQAASAGEIGHTYIDIDTHILGTPAGS